MTGELRHWSTAPATAAIAARVASTFTGAFGGEAAGRWAAPGRVNLIGEHVDYNAGRCLPIALRERTWCAARRRDDGRLHVASGDGHPPWSGAIDELDALAGPGALGWAAYVAGAVWALRRAGVEVPGLELALASDVPIGAGLSSSAALICAVALAAADLAGASDLAADRAALTAVCVEAETGFVGAPTGGMDQAASLRSRPGHALLLDCRDDSVEHVALDLGAAGVALLVIDTRVAHTHVAGGYGDRRAGCARAAARLGVDSLREVADATEPGGEEAALAALAGMPELPLARHVVTEIHRVAAVATHLRAGQVVAIGPLLDASHRSLRDDFAVSCRELDLAVATATAAGAFGARMTGGGFGGSAIALVPATAVDAVAAAVDGAFVEAGLTSPGFLVAEPGGPGARVD